MSTYKPGYIEGKVRMSLYLDPDVRQALRVRSAETDESMSDIVERLLRRDLGMTKLTWQVIEDNGGNLYLIVFDANDDVIYYADGYEHNEDGLRADLEALRNGDDTGDWEMQVDDAQAAYAALTSHEHGWAVVADQDGTYYSDMGDAALRAFNGYQAYIGADLMGEGGTEEEAIEAAVKEYEHAIGYGDEPHLFADRDALVEAIEVSIKEDE